MWEFWFMIGTYFAILASDWYLEGKDYAHWEQQHPIKRPFFPDMSQW